MSDLCLLINTCKGYYENIDNLIKQINTIESNEKFSRENILIVSGQEDENSVTYQDGIKIVKVTYTGLHLTSIIYICENLNFFRDKFTYFLALPDTIKFGKKFFTRLLKLYNKNIKNTNALSFPLINWKIRPTMDMGILHRDHILNMNDYIKKIKMGKPYNMDILKKLKKQLIYNENMILGQPSYFSKDKYTQFEYIFTFDSEKSIIPIVNNEEDVIENRIRQKKKTLNKVYIKPLDLYKFQRNFSLQGELVLEL
jgi:hypothetical protein